MINSRFKCQHVFCRLGLFYCTDCVCSGFYMNIKSKIVLVFFNQLALNRDTTSIPKNKTCDDEGSFLGKSRPRTAAPLLWSSEHWSPLSPKLSTKCHAYTSSGTKKKQKENLWLLNAFDSKTMNFSNVGSCVSVNRHTWIPGTAQCFHRD